VGFYLKRTVRQQSEYVPEASSGGVHDYFNYLITRPDLYNSWGLRTQSGSTGLDGLVADGVSTSYTYTYPSDTRADAQDAAKLIKHPNSTNSPSDALNIGQMPKFQIGISSGSILITWDIYYGQECIDNLGGLDTWKAWQVRDGNSSATDGAIFIENRVRWSFADPGRVGSVDFRMYSGPNPIPNGSTDSDPYGPTGEGALLSSASFQMRPNMWTRYWELISVNQDYDTFPEWNAFTGATLSSQYPYHRVSLWMADEITDPTRVLYRVPRSFRDPYLTRFFLQSGTSQVPSSNGSMTGQSGDMVLYARNVVMLRDYDPTDESDTRVFKRPI
jgi:hypothetical protein